MRGAEPVRAPSAPTLALASPLARPAWAVAANGDRQAFAVLFKHFAPRVDLRAEMDVLAVISNCPQINNPCNGFDPTPIQVQVGEGDVE